MNFRCVLRMFTRIFIVKKTIENINVNHLQNYINNIVSYSNNYNNMSYNERMMVHLMINVIN